MGARKWFRKQLHRAVQIEDSPNAVALGCAIGIFFGFTPLFGLKTLLAIGIAWLFRANKLAAAIAVTLHDVVLPLMPIILRVEYYWGYWLLSTPHQFPPHLHMHHMNAGIWFHWSTFFTIGRPLLVGSVIFATPFAVATFFVARVGLRYYRERQLREKAIEIATEIAATKPDSEKLK